MPLVFIGKAVDCGPADGRADEVLGVVVPVVRTGVVVPGRADADAEALATLVADAVGSLLALGAGVSVGGTAVGLDPPQAARKPAGTAAASIICSQRRRPKTCMVRSAPCVNQTHRTQFPGIAPKRRNSTTPGGLGEYVHRTPH
jgi:hypothetical protein